MTRSTKKQNRSKTATPPEEKQTKFARTVNDLLSPSSEEELNLTDTSDKTLQKMETPCGKLNFDEPIGETKTVIPDVNPDAPGWAKDLIKSVNELKQELSKVSTIAGSTQKSISNALKTSSEISSKFGPLVGRVSALEHEKIVLKRENDELREKLLLLEFHQRRNNLIFSGIPEVDDGGSESGFDCF